MALEQDLDIGPSRALLGSMRAPLPIDSRAIGPVTRERVLIGLAGIIYN